jgi:nucleoid-associated protein YgaU
MPIFKNSRYTTTPAYIRDGETVFRKRSRVSFNLTGAVTHRFTQGEHLDALALKYYNDTQLWWVILEANPKYRSELAINPGDSLIIPTYEEVMKCLIPQ